MVDYEVLENRSEAGLKTLKSALLGQCFKLPVFMSLTTQGIPT